MSSAEFTYWQAFYEREPWGHEADTWRMAVQCAVIANTAGRKKGGGAWTPKDFLPKRRRVKKPRADMPEWIKDKLETPDG